MLLGQFPSHPCSLMWSKHKFSLCDYGIQVCEIWRNRGFKDSLLDKILNIQSKLIDSGKPSWLGFSMIHESHQSNLLRKFPRWYEQFGWTVPHDLEYVWGWYR